MTLSEYITSEFGIVPDEVQIKKIYELSLLDLVKYARETIKAKNIK